MVPLFHDEGLTLAFVGDLIPSVAHMQPDLNMVYDRDSKLSKREKAGFLAEAEKKSFRLFFQHDLFTESVQMNPPVWGFWKFDV